MPFTLSHAAAAWPVRKLLPALPLSALVIGTLSPDFEYFLELAPISRTGHTPAGLILFCLPVSLLVWVVFRRVARPALVRLLPPGLAAAVAPPSTSWSLAAVAALIGALTHVIWDGFTHQRDWAVRTIPFLRIPVAPGLLGGVPWYKLLQQISSVAGLAAIVLWVAWWVGSQPSAARRWAPGQWTRVRRTLIGIAAGTLICAAANGALTRGPGVNASRVAVGGMIGASLSMLVIGLAGQWSRRRGA